MKSVLQNLASLLKVRSIVTILVIGCLCILAVQQNTRVTSEMLAAIVSSVITYFFTRTTDKVEYSDQKE